MDIFKLVGSIFVDTDEANKSISKTDGSVEELAGKFISGITTATKWGVKVAAAAATAAAAVGTAVVAMVENTRDYRTEMGKLETAFETADHSGEDAYETYATLQSILGETDQAVEAAAFLAKIADTEKELATWTDICTGVYAEFGASLPIEGLTESANETANVGAVTGSLADALNWAGESEDEFNEKLAECADTQERQNLIMDTLNGLYSESADLYRENNEEIIAANEASEKLTQKMAELGEVAEPAVTKVKEAAVKLLDKLEPLVEYTADTMIPTMIDLVDKGLEFVDEALETTEEYVEKFNDAMGNSSKKLEEAKEWCIQHQDQLVLLGIALGTATAAVVAFNAAKIMANITSGIETIAIYGLIVAENLHTIASTIATGATTAFGAAIAFLTSPITLIIVAIGLLVAAIYMLITHWDEVSAAVEEFGEKAVEKITSMVESVKMKFEEMKANAKAKVEEMKDKIDDVLDGIKDSFTSKLDSAKEKVSDTIDKIKSLFDFEWSLPKLKMPHVTISGGFSLSPLEVPKFGIEWYKDGGILMDPTLFGFNSITGNAMVGGEAGPEAIAPISDLMQYVQTAVRNESGATETLLRSILTLLEELLDYIKNNTGDVYLDSGALVGALRGKIDNALGITQSEKSRGL